MRRSSCSRTSRAKPGAPMLEIAADGARLGTLRPAARQALADFSALILRQRENAKDSAVDELLRNVIEEIRFADHLKAEGPEGMERIENVKELIAGASETVADEGGELGLTPLDHFLQHASLITDVDRQNPNADAVTMMTLHNAKGLEFPAVFITGLEDGLFPLRRAHDEPDQMEEERRLFYVGITRAMRTLYLSHARSRRRNGETMHVHPVELPEADSAGARHAARVVQAARERARGPHLLAVTVVPAPRPRGRSLVDGQRRGGIAGRAALREGRARASTRALARARSPSSRASRAT